MTTGILDALTQLFALFASGRTEMEELAGRQSASRYLSGRLSKSLVNRYLDSYDSHLETFMLIKTIGFLNLESQLEFTRCLVSAVQGT
jgi:hypothetical protein